MKETEMYKEEMYTHFKKLGKTLRGEEFARKAAISQVQHDVKVLQERMLQLEAEARRNKNNCPLAPRAVFSVNPTFKPRQVGRVERPVVFRARREDNDVVVQPHPFVFQYIGRVVGQAIRERVSTCGKGIKKYTKRILVIECI